MSFSLLGCSLCCVLQLMLPLAEGFFYWDLRVRSEEQVCVRKELGGCFVAGKDAIWHVGIGPGCRGQEASCQKWGGIFAFSFPCVEQAANEGDGSLARFQRL